jgi:hypothetical protein
VISAADALVVDASVWMHAATLGYWNHCTFERVMSGFFARVTVRRQAALQSHVHILQALASLAITSLTHSAGNAGGHSDEIAFHARVSCAL